MVTFTDEQNRFIHSQRVGRLATADQAGQPHVVPVCYAWDGTSFFVALDAKPKRVAPRRLKRIRNILANPQVALVVDRYSDDWSELGYILVRGTAALVPPNTPEHQSAVKLLRDRYPQYSTMPIHEQPVIQIRPSSSVSWGNLSAL